MEVDKGMEAGSMRIRKSIVEIYVFDRDIFGSCDQLKACDKR